MALSHRSLKENLGVEVAHELFNVSLLCWSMVLLFAEVLCLAFACRHVAGPVPPPLRKPGEPISTTDAA